MNEDNIRHKYGAGDGPDLPPMNTVRDGKSMSRQILDRMTRPDMPPLSEPEFEAAFKAMSDMASKDIQIEQGQAFMSKEGLRSIMQSVGVSGNTVYKVAVEVWNENNGVCYEAGTFMSRQEAESACATVVCKLKLEFIYECEYVPATQRYKFTLPRVPEHTASISMWIIEEQNAI